jgi:FAD/FMN-containing dehydrogenase
LGRSGEGARFYALGRRSTSAATALVRSSGERIYANYQSYAGKGTPEAVFGSNYPRLVALKNKYDPTNFFRRNSNVEPRQE